MNRRTAIKALGIPAVTGIGGALILTKNLSARAVLAQELERDSVPFQIEADHADLANEPERAVRTIKSIFSDACLNSSEFLEVVTSQEFRSQLEKYTEKDEKEDLIQQKFYAQVITPELIYNKTKTILKEIDDNISLRWKDTCKEIAVKWGVRIESRYLIEDLYTRSNEQIRQDISVEIDKVVKEIAVFADRPSISSLSEGYLAEAFLMLMLSQTPVLGRPVPTGAIIPYFVYKVIRGYSQYVREELAQNIEGAKYSISSRLTNLSEHVGDELSSEIRKRIDDYHSHREKAIRQVTKDVAKEEIGPLFG